MAGHWPAVRRHSALSTACVVSLPPPSTTTSPPVATALASSSASRPAPVSSTGVRDDGRGRAGWQRGGGEGRERQEERGGRPEFVPMAASEAAAGMLFVVGDGKVARRAAAGSLGSCSGRQPRHADRRSPPQAAAPRWPRVKAACRGGRRDIGAADQRSAEAMEDGGIVHTSLLANVRRTCCRDDVLHDVVESQSLLEHQQGPQIKSKRPDWRAPTIILVLECLESMAFNGVGTNLVVYIRSVLHGGIASSASTVSLWYGTSFFVPILGATIADTYLGNYETVLISLIMYLLGMVLITVATFMTYTPAMCSDSSCLSSNGVQNILFFAALYITAIGCGGVRSALLPFGADQFNNENSLDMQKRRNFFSFFYICVIFGVITSGTVNSLGSGKCELGYRIWHCHDMHRSCFDSFSGGNTNIPTA